MPNSTGHRSNTLFSTGDENTRLQRYEQHVKQAFANIESVLQQVSALQHETDFVNRAQKLSQDKLGFKLPELLLADCWIKPLDIGQLYAWCVFETVRGMSQEFYTEQPIKLQDEDAFQAFLQECGFHTMDVSPCADGRLAHVISYVLRLPYKAVRRKSYAGAMFDVEDSLQKWVKTEMFRHREAKPNAASEPTQYLKAAVYHFSSVKPDSEGCAAHGSDVVVAANAANERLNAFRQGVENTFCCGASIDLLLIGVDTDTDAIRLHLPNAQGEIDTEFYIDALQLASSRMSVNGTDESSLIDYLSRQTKEFLSSQPSIGMLRLAARLLSGNLRQIEYVRQYHNGSYQDIGHQECFIGMGIGFEEIQLRNLTYFAYLKTVEEGAKDMDVGIKIFTGLNASRGLPIPVVIRFDYHGQVPGAKERAIQRCAQLNEALRQRYKDYVEQGLLHTMQMIRDCNANTQAEVVDCSVAVTRQEMH